MSPDFLTHIRDTLGQIETDGLMKVERALTSPQGAHIDVAGRDMLNLCANNYLGLADNPALIAAAKQALDADGFGMARCASFVAPTICTVRSKPASQRFSKKTTRSFCRLF